MPEQDQRARPANTATAAAEVAAPPPPEPGPVGRQLLRVAEERGVVPAEGQDLKALLAALKIETPIPLEAMATVSGILLFLFQTDAGAAGKDRR